MYLTKKLFGRLIVFIYSIIAYVIGLGGLVYFILFLGNWKFLPHQIDSGATLSVNHAILINVGLVLAFGLQHSVMARPAFKQVLMRFIPKAAVRSTYVFTSGVMMLSFCLFWQPIDGALWIVKSNLGQAVLTAGYLFGWVFAVLASFVINHFELFGLQQAYRNLRNQPELPPHFTERFLYRLVRHPLQLGVLIGLWSTPTMTFTHLFLAIALTIYIFIGLYFEEKDLRASLGEAYENYQQRVPKVIPIPGWLYRNGRIASQNRGRDMQETTP
ncbi:methyltransferase family protein [Candidatus Leptofilum sp.]|uniref:methyltransferase family protein n=1 Tax=Candidatus Leptofilum sp. TaxID=3241576 RepID=UPI003B5CB449